MQAPLVSAQRPKPSGASSAYGFLLRLSDESGPYYDVRLVAGRKRKQLEYGTFAGDEKTTNAQKIAPGLCACAPDSMPRILPNVTLCTSDPLIPLPALHFQQHRLAPMSRGTLPLSHHDLLGEPLLTKRKNFCSLNRKLSRHLS